MESVEDRDISREINKEKYKENVMLLEKAKDKFIEMGLFNKDFLSGLSYVFIDKIEKEGDEYKSYQLTSDGKLALLEINEKELTRSNNFFTYSRSFLNNLSEDPEGSFKEKNKQNQCTFFWLENIDFKAFYSFEAVSLHEIAHTKSYAAITENDLLSFDQEKFNKLIKETVDNDKSLQDMKNINFSKFDHSFYDWSELYALLYHREYLRKENVSNENMIKEWDKHILKVASNLPEAMEKFNKERCVDIDPEMIYEDCHAFSFLLARIFEGKYKNFNERIKALESFNLYDKTREKDYQGDDSVFLEKTLGGNFISPPKVEYKNLLYNNSDLNPKDEYGACGAFDYGKRIVYLDESRIKQSGFSVDETRNHEFLHILELDLIGNDPTHHHLISTIFFGQKEQERILDYSSVTIRDKEVQKMIFGHEVDLNISCNELELKKVITEIEDALHLFYKKIEKMEPNLAEYSRVVASIIVSDLNDLKTVYFSLLLKDAKVAIAFEKGIQKIDYATAYYEDIVGVNDRKILRFEIEFALAKKTLKEFVDK